jgi:hypothetical protein
MSFASAGPKFTSAAAAAAATPNTTTTNLQPFKKTHVLGLTAAQSPSSHPSCTCSIRTLKQQLAEIEFFKYACAGGRMCPRSDDVGLFEP